MYEEQFSKRLAELRTKKGVSARDMSLSIGQNPGYIRAIECGTTFPTMSNFFYICEYLEVEPKDFFDTKSTNPTKANELFEIAKSLSNEQLDNLISLAKGLQK